jgi:hypothetical protein
MSLNLDRLEKVKERGNFTIARCPACAEEGHDRKGEHLFISDAGKFGCVLYPGEEGKEHRQRIFALVGVNDPPWKGIEVKKPSSSFTVGHKVIQRDILGHLGRL